MNAITRNSTFGAGAYPANSVSTFGATTAVDDTLTRQFGLRQTF